MVWSFIGPGQKGSLGDPAAPGDLRMWVEYAAGPDREDGRWQ
jgi:hypothetical protein